MARSNLIAAVARESADRGSRMADGPVGKDLGPADRRLWSAAVRGPDALPVVAPLPRDSATTWREKP